MTSGPVVIYVAHLMDGSGQPVCGAPLPVYPHGATAVLCDHCLNLSRFLVKC